MEPVAAAADEYFIGCDVSPNVFEMYWRLRGMEQAMIDMAGEPELAYEMLGRCADFAVELAEAACERFPLDWLWTGDDVASQRSLMMSPAHVAAADQAAPEAGLRRGQGARAGRRLPLLRRAAADHSRPGRDGPRHPQPDPVQLPRHERRAS